MKRKSMCGLVMLTAALLFSACGSSQSAAEATVTSAAAAAESESTQSESTQSESTQSESTQSEALAESSEAASEATEEASENGTHIVIDHGGNEVEVPDKIERVVIDQIPILSTYTAYFEGSAPYIVGYCGSFKETISETVLKNIAPELMESQDTVYAQSDLNIEEIIKLDPDVILYNANNEEHAQILQSSGIPAIGFATINGSTPADPLERYDEWLRLLEDVFNEPGKMDEFIARGDEIVADVEARIAEIPEEERPTAMILYKVTDGVPQVAGKNIFGDYWLQHLGVKNVAEETKGFAQVSFEQIYSWDPEVMFLNGPGLSKITIDDVMNNRIDGVDFSTIQAVEDGRVYDTTLGMWNWFTPNSDAPLVLAWLACNTYPEQFADYPLEDTIREYYKQSYGYDVTDEELAGMLELR